MTKQMVNDKLIASTRELLGRLNPEIIFYTLAFVLALATRFFNLGAAPLSESEASWALQALQIARPELPGEPLTLGPQPAYIYLTSILFTFFRATSFLARFWPALAGSLLALLSFCLRRPIGRSGALILAFGLALDPGLVTVSRIAGGPMMAMGFGLLGLGFMYARKPILGGLFAALALLSGPAIITGGLGLLLTWLAARITLPHLHERIEGFPERDEDLAGHEERQKYWRTILISALVTLFAAGTLFFQYPDGLAAWFDTIPAYLNGWASPSGIPALRLVAALLVYQPFALIFAFVGIIRVLSRKYSKLGNIPNISIIPLLWAFISLLLVIIYPGRQVSDLIWTLVPIWIMAAIELTNYLPDAKIQPIAMVQAAIVLIFVALFWNTLIATSRISPLPDVPWVGVQIAILGGIITLGVLTTALVALGWSWEASRDGLVWGLSAAFSVYLVSVLWGATQLRPNQPQELWGLPPATGQEKLFVYTLEDLSNWNTGFVNTLDIVSIVDAPSLAWALRDFPNTRFVQNPPMGEMPSVVITTQAQDTPSLAATYRGQDFAWWIHPDWWGALPPDIIDWLTFREAPLLKKYIVLWARSDLFPGGEIEPQAVDAPLEP